MTTIASSLAKGDDGLPLINRSSLAQISGVTKQLTRAEFNAAVTAERARIAANSVGLYQNGERLDIIGEAGSRIWTLTTGGTDAANAAASHANVVSLGLGKTVTLAADSNVALSAAGQPASGTGTNGDISVDFAAQLYYTKAAGAWGTGASTVFNGLSAAQVVATQALVATSGISGVTYDGSSRVSGYTVGTVTFTVAYPDSTHATITSSLGSSRSVTFDGSGRVTAII
jgi:hypothetical protein